MLNIILLLIISVNAISIPNYKNNFISEKYNNTIYYCQNNTECPPNSYCNINYTETTDECQCILEYASYNGLFCNHHKKSLVITFFLDLFFDPIFPAGQVYLVSDNWNFSVLQVKLTLIQIFTSGIILWIILLIIKNIIKNTRYNKINLTSIWCLTTLLWWLFNIILNTSSNSTDGYGVKGYWN